MLPCFPPRNSLQRVGAARWAPPCFFAQPACLSHISASERCARMPRACAFGVHRTAVARRIRKTHTLANASRRRIGPTGAK
eukprot:12382535-Alexandrium_andersonii.AAC.1